ncbi:MAG: lipopolysaccharide biosynthesis protein RfbH, partial [Actinobacteria bacterium]|nr:lipopolysaccharide biosynthesis protein RfbH [Actinomycetota bacterium]
EKELRQKMDELIIKLIKHRQNNQKFIPGKTKIQYAGAVYDEKEITKMIHAILDGWFSSGKYTLQFENSFARMIGASMAISVNSGSSANLLTIATLFSNRIPKGFKLQPGDEIITTGLSFPTTVNPIIQYNLTPIFVDVELGTYNPSAEDIEDAISPRTRGIFITHTLGNPNEMDYIMELVEDKNLVLIEDSCDALGSKYNGKYVGTFGHFGTFSFYPAHHITTGEGGMVVTNEKLLGDIVKSLRDWGRACIMPICNPSTCGDLECPRSLRSKSKNIFGLPEDYDKRYTYIEIGYNLKMTEIQAAMGLAQLEKLPEFIKLRKRNFKLLYNELMNFEDYFILPEWHKKSDVSWFAFPLTIRKEAPFKRRDIVRWLLQNNIEVKLFFSGNILRHPAYRNIKAKVHKSLQNSDFIMENSFFIGVYPGLTEEKINYIIEKIREFVSNYKR